MLDIFSYNIIFKLSENNKKPINSVVFDEKVLKVEHSIYLKYARDMPFHTTAPTYKLVTDEIDKP
jgi:hypothetical protein